MRSFLAWSAAALVATGCGSKGSPGQGGPQGGAAAALQPLSLTIPAGAGIALGAEGRVRAIARLPDDSLRTVTDLAKFQSSSPSVLEFPPDAPPGTYRALALGPVTISASYEGLSASVTVAVAEDEISALVIDPAPVLVPVGEAVQLRATAWHRSGAPEDVTASATWTTDAPQVISVSNAGVATAVGAGSAIVRASFDRLSAANVVDVTASLATQLSVTSPVQLVVGGTTTFSGWLRFADQTGTAAGSVGTLTPADPSVVGIERVWNGSIDFRGLAPGSTTVAVEAGGLSQEVAVQVTAPTSLALDVPGTVVVGTNMRVGVAAHGAGTSASASKVATWSSDAPSVADVALDESGSPRLIAKAPGTAHISAAVAGTSATATVTVAEKPARLEVTPASFQVPVRGTQRLTATGHYASGATIDLTAVVDWTVCDFSIGGFYYGSPPGEFTGSTTGVSFVAASIAGLVGRTEATVHPELPPAIHIRPLLTSGAGPYALPPGATARFSAGWDANLGWKLLSGVAWSTSDGAVAAFSSDPSRPGELTALSPGTTTITATYTTAGQARTATAELRVAPLLGLVAPASLEVIPGDYVAPLVEGSFDGGAGPFTADVTPWVSWSSDLPMVAVPWNGAIFGASPGGAVLTAALGASTALVPVAVSAPSVASLEIAVPSDPVPGGTFRPTATAMLVPHIDYGIDVTDVATWTADGTVLSVSGTPPVVQVLAPGTGALTATFRGASVTRSVDVPVDPWYALLPDARALYLGRGRSASVRLGAFRQNVYNLESSEDATVTSSNPAVATAEPNSTNIHVKASGPGEAILTASYGGVQTRFSVNVFDFPVEFMMWDSPQARVHVHELLWLSTLPSSTSYFVTFSGEELQWTSSDPSVVEVVAPGMVQGLKPGHALVVAASPTWMVPIAVTVSDAAVVAVEPPWPALPAPLGTELPLSARATYADGADADITHAVQWSSADPTIADLDTARPGVVRPKAAGNTRIEMQLDGLAGSTIVTVF
jgi:hypothetical protein